MICPNCNSNMSDKRKRCERCGTDLTVYKKVLRASNLYYNNGLARAKVRDLSGAAIALRKSLDLNKWNTNARNLLGLVYYEMGETVAALSEWVISRHFQAADNDAEEYINKVQSNPTRLDALNQAIKRYNTALNFAKQGSDDLAIIQLKKVVSLNPHFIRAYHLLALLLMKTGENDKAKKYLIKVGKMDVSNTKTLCYLHEMEAPVGKDLDSNPEAEQQGRFTNSIMPISSYKEDKPNIMVFVNLVIGVLIGIAVTAILIIPTIKKNITTDENSAYTNNATEIAELEDKNSTLLAENNDLQTQINQLKDQINSVEVTTEDTSYYPALLSAALDYITELDKIEKDRDYSAIADTLAEIDDSQIKDDASRKLLTDLRNATYPSVAKYYYNLGHDLYSSGSYEEALLDLSKAMTLDPEDVNAVYFMARAYHRIDDKENAAKYYNIVITDFPDSSRVTDAKDFLKQVQQS